MASALYVDFRGDGFWAYDVVNGILLKHLVDVAELHLAQHYEDWLALAVEQWKFNAVIADCGLYLEDDWSAEQIQTLKKLISVACSELEQEDEISAGEMESWQLLNGAGVFSRGLPAVRTSDAVRLGRALVQLLDGVLPEAPPGTWWFFATEGDAETLAKRKS